MINLDAGNMTIRKIGAYSTSSMESFNEASVAGVETDITSFRGVTHFRILRGREEPLAKS